MGHSGHRPPPLAVVVMVAIVTVGCGGASRNDASSGSLAEAPDEPAAVTPEDRCDLGFNTAQFNETTQLVQHGGHHDMSVSTGDVDFTLRQWAETFVDEELGMTVQQVVDELGIDGIYRRHVLQGVLTHTLDPDPWTPMTHRDQCVALAGELAEARAAATHYPTVADALADGYTLGDRYFAGLGVHYQNSDYYDVFDPGRPAQLLFDGTDVESGLVGLSYVVRPPGDIAPEGFTGHNDFWHRHRTFCLDLRHGGVNLSSDVLTEEECVEMGGTHVPNPGLWMLHVWVVPGCESDWGTFSGANPRLPYIPDDASFISGCNSGKTVAEPLELDEQGGGPGID